MNIQVSAYDPAADLDLQESELTASVNQRSRRFYSPIQDESGNWIYQPIGRINANRYQGINDDSGISTMTFVPDEGRSYDLGQFSRRHVIDNRDLLHPLTSLDWKIESVESNRGGARMAAIVRHPDIKIDDFIDWDLAAIGAKPADAREMHAAIMIRGSAKRGTSYVYTAGLFRMVCTNGLISSMLDLGQLTIPHSQVDRDGLAEKVIQQFHPDHLRARYGQNSWSQRVYPMESLSWLLRHLKTFLAEGSKYHMPAFLAEPTNALMVPYNKSEKTAMITQLEALQGSALPTFSVLDLLNLITNVSGKLKAMMRLEATISNLTAMADIAEWKVS